MNFLELPLDLSIFIIDFLNFKELINIIQVNKYCFVNYYQTFANKKKTLFFKKMLPKHVYNLIENYDVDKIKYLDFDEEYIGIDYIDRIRTKDVESSIMYSVDCFKRPFLTFLINLKKDNKSFDIVHTLFQRYSNEKNHWVFGTCYSNFKIHIQAAPSKKALMNYKNLINNEILNIDDYQIKL